MAPGRKTEGGDGGVWGRVRGEKQHPLSGREEAGGGPSQGKKPHGLVSKSLIQGMRMGGGWDSGCPPGAEGQICRPGHEELLDGLTEGCSSVPAG